jgi:dipeptidyl aminopeptidase/acylaminoacyl peptidase
MGLPSSMYPGARSFTAGSFSWVALIALSSLLSVPPASAVPLEVYGRLPQIEDVALSPDGSQIAFVRTEGDERIIWVGPLADPRKAFPMRVGDEKLRGIAWADEDHVLLYMSAAKLATLNMPGTYLTLRGELFQMQVLDLRSRKTEIVPRVGKVDTGDGLRWLNLISGNAMVRHLDGHTVLFIPGIYVTNETLPALFRLDLTNGVQQLLKRGTESSAQWLVGDDGSLLAQEDYYEHGRGWVMLARLNGDRNMTEVASGHSSIDLPTFLGYGFQPDTLLVQEPDGDKDAWKLLSLQDGKLGPPLGGDRTFRSPIEDYATKRMIGGVYLTDYPHYVFFDPDLQTRWDEIIAAFSGEQVRFVSASNDFTKFVVLVAGAKHGFAYFFVDLGTGHASLIGSAYGGLTAPLEVRSLTYPAQDGFLVPAYLTLPAGRTPQNLPLVVLPHGGPAASDDAEFDWWSQALADQGYAVLRPNYRGSDLGRPFLEAGFGQWGRKMQTDLSDGVRYLAKEGIVDPARVCIVGASYGGYAALAGVTLQSGIYRCAASIAGPADLKLMLKREGWGRTQRYWDRYMGVTGPSDPTLDAISPIKHVDAISVPVLLIHGHDDVVVPYEQSRVMYEAMKRANKNVDLVTLKREDHWLSRSETRLQMLRAVVQFLRAHNPPG